MMQDWAKSVFFRAVFMYKIKTEYNIRYIVHVQQHYLQYQEI